MRQKCHASRTGTVCLQRSASLPTHKVVCIACLTSIGQRPTQARWKCLHRMKARVSCHLFDDSTTPSKTRVPHFGTPRPPPGRPGTGPRKPRTPMHIRLALFCSFHHFVPLGQLVRIIPLKSRNSIPLNVGFPLPLFGKVVHSASLTGHRRRHVKIWAILQPPK